MLPRIAINALLAGLIAATARDQEPLAISCPKKPNIVFFLTDDQDVHLNSLAYQPHLRRHLINEGLQFNRHFCTVALCCPSRVNLWTGKAAHNTNVTDVNPPYGGYPKFVSQGLNDRYLPVWLQEAGYQTYYTGKLFNAHTTDNYNDPFPAGWTGSDFLLDPYTYFYLNSTYQRNQDLPVSYEGQHTVDVLSVKAKGFLEDAVRSKEPFFLAIAPVAPHSNVEVHGGTLVDPKADFTVTPPVSAERHKHLFRDVKIPRTEHFNPIEASGANWIRRLPRQSEDQVEYNDEFYRGRLRALQSVDELVDDIFNLLDRYEILDDTYVIYTSDNGYHIGQHRLPPGKECGFEEDVNVPLIIRGPGIPRGVTTNQVTSHTDLLPTIFQLAGIEGRDAFDGAAIRLSDDSDIKSSEDARHEHVNLEYWGFALAEGDYGFTQGDPTSKVDLDSCIGYALQFNVDGTSPTDRLVINNTYKAVRVISDEYNLYYSVWCNNEHELYDLSMDPYQLYNIHPSVALVEGDRCHKSVSTVLGLPVTKLISRLDALLLVLKSCKGITCVKPWQELHPEGDVLNLKDALHPKFDYYYEEAQVKVEFSRCEQGQLLDAEGPQSALVYRDGLSWSEWT